MKERAKRKKLKNMANHWIDRNSNVSRFRLSDLNTAAGLARRIFLRRVIVQGRSR